MKKLLLLPLIAISLVATAQTTAIPDANFEQRLINLGLDNVIDIRTIGLAAGIELKNREDGPSDHAPFYAVGIPALHFWTGKHDDYHKPSDDVEKINFEAESKIISFIEMFVMSMDEKGKVDIHKRENK